MNKKALIVGILILALATFTSAASIDACWHPINPCTEGEVCGTYTEFSSITNLEPVNPAWYYYGGFGWIQGNENISSTIYRDWFNSTGYTGTWYMNCSWFEIGEYTAPLDAGEIAILEGRWVEANNTPLVVAAATTSTTSTSTSSTTTSLPYTKQHNISDGVDAGIDFGVAFIVKLADRSPDIADIVVFTLVIGLLFGAVFVILDLPTKIKAKFKP